jgi:pseudaminic acid cytidylyltransferase
MPISKNYSDKKIIAIIPARAGSKRVPKKNYRDFCGKPMISWVIQKLQTLDCIDEIIVSTDSTEIKSIAEKSGAKVPFLRPKEISDDFTTASAVIKHALDWYVANNEMPFLVFAVYPTAVLVPAERFLKSIDIIDQSKSTKLITVQKYSHPIERAIFKNSKDLSAPYSPKNIFKRTQDLEASYYDAGQFYLSYPEVILNGENFLTDSSMLVLSRDEAIDIDSEEDFLSATEIFQNLYLENV